MKIVTVWKWILNRKVERESREDHKSKQMPSKHPSSTELDRIEVLSLGKLPLFNNDGTRNIVSFKIDDLMTSTSASVDDDVITQWGNPSKSSDENRVKMIQQ